MENTSAAEKAAKHLTVSYYLNNLKTELDWVMFNLNRGNIPSAKSNVELALDSLEDVVRSYQEGFKAAKEAEYEKGYLQGLKDAKHLPENPSEL